MARPWCWSYRCAEQPGFDGAGRVAPDRHGGVHAQEAKPGIEGLGAWVRIQDDFLVSLAAGHELADDRRAQPVSLVGWVDGHVGDVGAVTPVRQRTPGTGQGA